MSIDSLRTSIKNSFVSANTTRGQNLGLQFDRLPFQALENGDSKEKSIALDIFAGYKLNADPDNYFAYEYAYKNFLNVVSHSKNVLILEITSLTKSIFGSGNSSNLEIGLQLNKPWGVPYITGSTIKGALSSYLSINGDAKWFKSLNSTKKGINQVEIFGGSLEIDKGETDYAGSLIFNDAWILPESCKDTWYVRDIITTHHQDYYAGSEFPHGMNNPIPINTLALKPGLKFLCPIFGNSTTLDFIKQVIEKMLIEQGIGAKTSIGYGRFECKVKDYSAQIVIEEEKQKLSSMSIEDKAFYEFEKLQENEKSSYIKTALERPELTKNFWEKIKSYLEANKKWELSGNENKNKNIKRSQEIQKKLN